MSGWLGEQTKALPKAAGGHWATYFPTQSLAAPHDC